ncbi:MAG: flippase [Candidatus Aenigmarchaeota archaeon]|nr:flippase [Candidatus Aenigmarchaeota archaeon]
MGIAKNYFYNVLLQISNILIPLITTPYVTRVLDPSGFGIVSFANSIVQYFILFGTLGLNLYGSRLIAYVRNDKEKLEKTFWELFWLRSLTIFLAILSYIIFLYLSNPSFIEVYLIQILNLLAVAFDISFLFIGMEKFKIVSLRGVTARLITAGLIFILVKGKDDFAIYALINAIGNLVSQVIVWKYLFQYIPTVKRVPFRKSVKHLPGSVKLFIPMIAIQIYTVLDRTMLGILSSEDQVGIYTPGVTLVKMATSLVTSLGTVMLSRISNLVANKEERMLRFYSEKAFDFATYASLFIVLNLYILMPSFVPIFFGKEFQSVLHVIKVICPIVLFISWSNFFGIQLMLPMQLEKAFTLSVSIGAIVNFFLNLFLIPKHGAIGASIATVVAEFSVTLSQMILIRTIINLFEFFKKAWKHFLSAFGTFVISLIVSRLITFEGNNLFSLVLNGLLVAVSYFLMEKMLKSGINDIVFSKMVSFLRRFFRVKSQSLFF